MHLIDWKLTSGLGICGSATASGGRCIDAELLLLLQSGKCQLLLLEQEGELGRVELGMLLLLLLELAEKKSSIMF